MEENKQELKGAWLDKKRLILKQIPTSSATGIMPSTSNTECCQIAQGWAVVNWGWAPFSLQKSGVERCWDKAERWHRCMSKMGF